MVDAEQMKQIDQLAIAQIGLPSMILMERAALSVVQFLRTNALSMNKVLVVCGVGNNGGDGVAIARMLYLEEKNVEIGLFGQREKVSEETSAQLDIAEKVGLNIRMPDEIENLAEYTLIVDALFRIGLNHKIEGAVFDLIQSINQASSIFKDYCSRLCLRFTGRIWPGA